MRTVKQVSELTGVSVRTLQYYDEIGLFKPSQVTESGYRMYDDDALEVLQQIMFFKELDFPLKDIKSVMQNPKFEKNKAFENQKKLIQTKRDRLDGLLNLLDKLIKGEKCMSFKEFDMSEYFNALETFKEKHTDEIIKHWSSVDEFDKMTEDFKSKETEIAQMAVTQYGSIEKYTEAMKKNLSNFSGTMESLHALKDNADAYLRKSNEITERLTSDLNKDTASQEIQQIVDELIKTVNEDNKAAQNIDMGDNYWGLMSDLYLSNPAYIEVTDKKYGKGASEFIGKALNAYLR
ncbi:transcriptional regulator, MerR family [Anaerovirgula multivorans]|uniref:Transcriptional regulator, MerR family n=1 Tax=Anaerovirgula multivorans TaxID=312168 RepID=A0A239IE98_9FIRM|nr:MerR family transcriptional regulator [Anaerovirgula multivorans]SNS90754.1 transcriptional regulator, MerR family [Anaerovirgula multivorans]